MRVLIVGTHSGSPQPSMHLFTEWFAAACQPLGAVRTISAPSIFLRPGARQSKYSKWLMYLDNYLVFPFQMLFAHRGYDRVVLADHSNAPCTLLLPGEKLVAMVHDTIAIRHALTGLPGMAPTGSTGRILQRAIVAGLRRARALMSNPPPVPDELRSLGIDIPTTVVGCPFDRARLGDAAPTLPQGLDDVGYFLNVGSDSPRKRKAELLKFWRGVEAIDPTVRLVLAGETSQGSRELIRSLGLRNVLVLGSVDDNTLAALYRNARALVVASQHEGFCIPVLESLAMGRPVVTPADVPFFRDVFGHAVRPILHLQQSADGAFLENAGAGLREDEVNAAGELLERYSLGTFAQRVRSVVAGIQH